MEDMDMNPSNLCREFARILNSTPSVVNGVCLATRSRTNIHPVVLGRKAEAFMFIPQAFSFESMDQEGRALCLGETVILQKEINPFMSKLREHGIKVTAVHNHWLFDKPRLMYMHFESIDKPLSFARKVRDAMRVLITESVRAKPSTNDQMIEATGLCDEFNDILGGTMHTFENGICTVMKSRTNIKPIVLGRPGRSFLLIPQMFTFESMTSDGRALCSGETVILQKEINPFISKLREYDIIVTAVHNHWLFDKPRLMFMHFESIDKPLDFARKVRNALRVLTTEEVRG
ncbi:DUF1259 domain-containing protein [Bacillus sp. ISL-51]|uniref:DUF1259 domain-containing protein n=1 Tax=Bacteria TaxID=2 RepID=UPI001BE558F2|nr:MULTISPECIES: DUF1259 domain-containing protein [Bacteria]MBT2573124.1 DUF1259 domain-containing protein [Bacillus sp. ISL-51]MBT2635027.1 DUF1259 domain-containing protein [Bacillus sp. ISL-26]MBT2712055.1 DUF1259 domain-containing protein [Pseudomonas sp. ISL-88]